MCGYRIEIVADCLRMKKAQQSSRVCALLVVMPRKKANTITGFLFALTTVMYLR